MTKINLFYHYL